MPLQACERGARPAESTGAALYSPRGGRVSAGAAMRTQEARPRGIAISQQWEGFCSLSTLDASSRGRIVVL
jgi:hypothetical protein